MQHRAGRNFYGWLLTYNKSMDGEEQWIAGARAGDNEAFRKLHELHFPSTYRVVRSLINNDADAEELTQEVWIKIYDKLGSFRGKSSFRTWAFTIAKNKVRDHIRKKMRRKGIFTRLISGDDEESNWDMAVSDETPRAVAEAGERLERFNAALEQLPTKLRLAFTLREREGLSYKEIAMVLKCKEGTVMSRLHQARQTLAAWMKDDL